MSHVFHILSSRVVDVVLAILDVTLLNAILIKLYYFKIFPLERTIKSLIELTFRRSYIYFSQKNRVLVNQKYRALFVFFDLANNRYISNYISDFETRNNIYLRYAIAWNINKEILCKQIKSISFFSFFLISLIVVIIRIYIKI